MVEHSDSEGPPWVSTLGGPLIVIPESACRHWNGGQLMKHPDDEGDYRRACDVNGYIGLIDVGPAKALVLGDGPADTTFLAGLNLFVRWIAADSPAQILHVATEMAGSARWEEELTWDIQGPVILFDSVLGYEDLATEEHIRVELPAGRYSARAAYIQTERVWTVIVQLVRDLPA
ncbi:Imm21 family immunity protein [Herbidospora cretacea]|uniref:Imm21 family immunity protein n=1 Tax=Herbidospora cretacea TaxID=28444 RepID=UPI0007C68EDA|nr:Imm21 family immunity protein [Herbidospora cretacea]